MCQVGLLTHIRRDRCRGAGGGGLAGFPLKLQRSTSRPLTTREEGGGARRSTADKEEMGGREHDVVVGLRGRLPSLSGGRGGDARGKNEEMVDEENKMSEAAKR